MSFRLGEIKGLLTLRISLKLTSLIFILAAVGFFSIFIGPVKLPIQSVLHVFQYQFLGTHPARGSSLFLDYTIVYYVREPQILAAIIVGASLGIGGAVVQSIFRNPITEPYIIGISSGAALGAVMAIGYNILIFGFYTVQILAFLSSLTVVSLIYFMSVRRSRVPITYFLLIGISVSLLISAVVAYVMITNTRLAGESEILSWLMGSLQAIGWKELIPVSGIIAVTSLINLSMSRELDAIQMGEDHASSVGVRVELVKRVGIISTTLGVSAAVSISGLIGFVGLIMPHVARLIFGGSNKLVLPASAILGAIFLLLADDVSRVIISQQVVPVGIITSFVGVPVFMVLLRRLAFGYYEN